jgi:hypothetical protein
MVVNYLSYFGLAVSTEKCKVLAIGDSVATIELNGCRVATEA